MKWHDVVDIKMLVDIRSLMNNCIKNWISLKIKHICILTRILKMFLHGESTENLMIEQKASLL